MRSILAISILFFSLSANAQRQYIHGLVKDSALTEVLQEAHVLNISAGKLAVIDTYGKFRVPAKEGDTLIISHIGFQDLISVVSEGSMDKGLLEFNLVPDPIYLPEVVINDFPDYERFKQMIVETEPEPELEIYGMNSLPEIPKEVTVEDLQNSTIGPSVGIPINLDAFSKKGKELKKMNKILENQRNVEIANQKFNREWVALETKLQGDELTDFIAFCNFSIKYLVNTSRYEIHVKMMAMLEDFKAEKMDS